MVYAYTMYSTRIYKTLLILGLLLVPASAVAEDFRATCKFFTSVSFNDRHTADHVTFRMHLADDCVEALRIHDNAKQGSVAYEQSRDYLIALQTYRQTLVNMAADRFDARPISRPGFAQSRPMTRPISQSGAFLIAKVMGLLDSGETWRAWREAAVR